MINTPAELGAGAGMTASDVLAFSPDGRLLAASLLTGGVRVFDPTTGRVLRTLADPGNETVSLAFAPTGDVLAAGTLAGTVELWDPVTAKRIAQPLLADSAAISDIAFDRSGQRFATTGLQDATVKIWFTGSLEQEGPRLAADPDATAATAFRTGQGRTCSSSTITAAPSHGRCHWRVGSSAPARSPVETSLGPSGRSSFPDRRTRACAVSDHRRRSRFLRLA